MNFYVAAAGDPRLHTVSVQDGMGSRGVETWITASEMQTLMQKLDRSPLAWQDRNTIERFKPWMQRTDGRDTFDVTVVSSKGTTRAGIRIAQMCDQLLQFDSLMPTPRLRWQFQTMRWDDGCVIPGYHNEEKPPE